MVYPEGFGFFTHPDGSLGLLPQLHRDREGAAVRQRGQLLAGVGQLPDRGAQLLVHVGPVDPGACTRGLHASAAVTALVTATAAAVVLVVVELPPLRGAVLLEAGPGGEAGDVEDPALQDDGRGIRAAGGVQDNDDALNDAAQEVGTSVGTAVVGTVIAALVTTALPVGVWSTDLVTSFFHGERITYAVLAVVAENG